MLDLATLEIVLPRNARLDLAYSTLETPSAVAKVGKYIVPSGEYAIVLQAYYTLTTDATVANRVGTCSAVNPSTLAGNMVIPAPVVQPASVFCNYFFSTDLAAAWSPPVVVAQQIQANPLPTYPLPAKGEFNAQVLNVQAGDFLTDVVFSVLHVPSGPAREESHASGVAARFREILGLRG